MCRRHEPPRFHQLSGRIGYTHDLDIDQLKKHPVIVPIIIAATAAGATWAVAQQVLVAPRDFEITSLQRRVETLQKQLEEEKQKPRSATAPATSDDAFVLNETGVMVNTSVTTTDGICSITIDSVSGSFISLSAVTVSSARQPIWTPRQSFQGLKPGDRAQVDVMDNAGTVSATYWINLLRIRGDIVDLSVFRQKQQKESGHRKQ
jgi:hypothetical protein